MKRPATRADPQPHAGPSVSASSSVTSTPESSTAPTGSGFDGVLTGDSGTNRQTPIAATPTNAAPTMKIHRHDA